MLPDSLLRLRSIYRDGLLNDTLPFWLPRAVDPEHGGYFTSLDRDGTILQTDKAIWFQGRFAWVLATLFRTVEPRVEWLEAARHGIEFLQAHGFDQDGRMFFAVTRDGRPLRKRRYVYSECFATMALAAYGLAARQPQTIQQAIDLFRLVLRYHRAPGLLEPKTIPATRPTKGLAMTMTLIVTAQELRKALADPELTTDPVRATASRGATEPAAADQARAAAEPGEAWLNAVIDEAIDEIERDFLKREFRCVLETVGPSGEFYDTFDGRLTCPGHAIEAGWFILEEARQRGADSRLLRLGTTIIDWSLEQGWDPVYGGMLYFRDARGLPSAEYWHDMKFWWPHNESLIATLLAWRMTGQARYARWHQQIHDWAYARFPDPVHGEWFGYLHRDGTLSTRLKGNMWKGPFHLPRMQWRCWQLLEQILKETARCVTP